MHTCVYIRAMININNFIETFIIQKLNLRIRYE